MIRYKKFREHKNKRGRKLHYEKFPDSIATIYMKNIRPGVEMDLDLLYRILIIKTRETKDLPDENDIIIHIRSGDVIESEDIQTVFKLIYDPDIETSEIGYSPSFKYIENRIKKVDRSKIRKLIFISGSHFDLKTPKSCFYLEKIAEGFMRKGYDVELRLGRNADDDFIYMSNARYFLQSSKKQGGFSKIIAAMVKRNGNTVL